MKLTINDLKKEIQAIDNIEDLKFLNKALIAHWREVERDKALSKRGDLLVGDKVQWESKKTGGLMAGTIVKKNFSRAQVMVNPGGLIWNVPFTMLVKAQG